MDGKRDRLRDEWMTEGGMNGWIIGEGMDNRWREGWMDGHKDVKRDGWRDGWIDGCMEGQTEGIQ